MQGILAGKGIRCILKMRSIVEMRLSANLLIICVLLVCIWFFYANRKTNAYYRVMFSGLIWFCVVAYINHIFGLCLMEGIVPYTKELHELTKTIHYLLTAGIYTFYAFTIAAIFHQLQYLSCWKKILILLPNLFLDGLIIASPWTEWVFYIQDGECMPGKFYLVMIGIRALYAVVATCYAMSNRKLLPGIFGQSITLISCITVGEFIMFILLREESVFYVVLVLNVIILSLVLTVVEFYRDVQTQLFNSEAFEQYINKEINKKGNQTLYLIKMKNYEYLKENCHEMALFGAVKELADCLKEYSQLTSVYYLGNGRYTIIVPKKSAFSEEKFLKELEERFCIPFDVIGASVTLSLFVSIINLESGKINKSNFWKYFKACDNMKYRSTQAIEVVYGDHFGIDHLQRYHDVEEAIQRALVEQEFRMYYQPVVDADTQKVVCAEALIRLYDRVLGFISPEEFIPISEASGKILEISDFVIDSVFQLIKEHDLKSLGIEFVEMNLSMIQCMDSNLPEKLKYYLDKYEIDPKYVNLEITETATSYDEERLRKQLEIIKKMGFSFSLDDYGTGYSNLVRVLEYPVDIIKLDKTVVWSAFHSTDNYSTIKNLIFMFHDVRRKIVAEGVESEEQMKELVNLGCDYLQGYYYSKPIPPEDLIKFIVKYNG